MRNILLIFACLFCLSAGLNAQILSPLPPGKIDLIVLFPPGTNEANIARCRTELGATEESISFPSGTRVWRMADTGTIKGITPFSYSFIKNPTDAVGRVQGRTNGVGVGIVSYVQINTKTQAPLTSTIKKTSDLPQFNSCGLDGELMVSPLGSRNVKVAILDTGLEHKDIEGLHPVLKHFALLSERRNFSTSTRDMTNVKDDHGHGTAVASVVVRGFMELGSNLCQIVPIKVLDKTAQGTLYGIIQGLDHAMNIKADIINISVVSQEKTRPKGKTPIEMVMNIAEARGILIVSAAGNDSQNIDLDENIRYPACAQSKNQIVVGAATCYNENVASFASVGQLSIDLFAPGEGVGVYSLARIGGGEITSGSSFAAPTVAGVAAALLTHMSSRNLVALKCAILEWGTTRSILAGKCVTGKTIHAPRALEKLASCGAVVLPPVVSVREILVDIQIGADPLLGATDMVKLVVLFSGGKTLEFDKINFKQNWAANSLQKIRRTLPADTNLNDIVGIRLETKFSNTIGSDTSWDLNRVIVSTNDGRTVIPRINQSGAPLHRFAGGSFSREFRR
ncbi:S8 family peptidase [Haliscomenobacter hydrossis]|uniref:Peptidase S8 and S53 subtilisin kexin sedolisin n=1 Tax=Haliscomenobacter hydrossis (strain ATCC 27775 / DSM 1100 / LMG 10767 / O) TaxID=760192 RepID=F4KQC1_HALH1|nr:S8 family serine peptidase [Haliscomenobacter hydrossis]AEE48947.1 peptidase S8 and S53 subtilisin kexin sedolisin [Haliscomenobacter hydrossis DSM 1100]